MAGLFSCYVHHGYRFVSFVFVVDCGIGINYKVLYLFKFSLASKKGLCAGRGHRRASREAWRLYNTFSPILRDLDIEYPSALYAALYSAVLTNGN